MFEILKYSVRDMKNPFGSVTRKLNGLLWSIGKNAFLYTVVFILAGTLFAEFIFYQYVFIIQQQQARVVVPLVHFEENTYKSVLNEWQQRYTIFSNPSPTYVNPFL